VNKNAQSLSLKSDIKVDVAVIGGGIAGIMTAYYLAKSGKSVALLEKDFLLSGETGNTTAFLTEIFDSGLHEVRKIFGKKLAKKTWEAGRLAVNEIERIARVEKIDCDFMRVPAYIFASDKQGFQSLRREYDLAQEMGFTNVEIFEMKNPSFKNYGYLKVENQAKFNARKFLIPLAKKAAAAGVKIFEKTEVLSCSGKNPTKVITSGENVTAKSVVVCTNAPNEKDLEAAMRVVAYQTYVLEIEIPKMKIEEAIYWDTSKPYKYFRIDGNRMILGGMDHETGKQKGDPYAELEKYFKKTFGISNYKILKKWSGQVIESLDTLPFMGRTIFNKHRYIATGFAGAGMTMGTLSAMVNTDQILGRKNVYSEMFSTLRIKSIFKISLRGFNYFYHLFKDRFSRSDVSLDTLKKDSGAILNLNGEKVAVYKNEKGELNKLSAVCTHLKCIVNWNDSEKTWDCPCHGSRFKKTGEVLAGPAREPLIRIGKK
jgi:glycine/D-amino acid oxidase-like deaminating enzyme/nitrite reductase/ring-hydroxylating ferredoxin subunit